MQKLRLAPARAGFEPDAGFFLARLFFLLGCAAVSVLLVRIGGVTAGDVLLGTATLILLLAHPTRFLPWPPRRWFAAIAVAFVLLGGWLATLVSPDPSESFTTVGRMIFLCVTVPLAARLLLTTERSLRWAFVATGIGAAMNGAATAAQAAFGVPIPGAQATTADRYSGLTANVSDTGAICALGVVVGFGLLGRGPWRRGDLFAALIGVLSIVGVMLSGSVSGMLSAAAGIAVVALLRGLSSGKLLTAAVAVGLAAAVGISIIKQTEFGLSPTERVLQVTGLAPGYAGTDTASSRLSTIEAGWASFLQHPVTGVGLDIASSSVYQGLPVHNLPVALLHVGGVFFAFGVLATICALVVPAIVVRHRASLAPLALGLATAAVLFAFTAPGYYNRYLWIPLALCSVLPLTLARAKQRSGGAAD